MGSWQISCFTLSCVATIAVSYEIAEVVQHSDTSCSSSSTRMSIPIGYCSSVGKYACEVGSADANFHTMVSSGICSANPSMKVKNNSCTVTGSTSLKVTRSFSADSYIIEMVSNAATFYLVSGTCVQFSGSSSSTRYTAIDTNSIEWTSHSSSTSCSGTGSSSTFSSGHSFAGYTYNVVSVDSAVAKCTAASTFASTSSAYFAGASSLYALLNFVVTVVPILRRGI